MDKSKILCSKTHEFIYKENDLYYVGIMDILLNKMGKIDYIDLPKIGEIYTKGEIFAFLKSKTIGIELFMPITGKIEEINNNLFDNIASIEDNWIIKISSEFYNQDKKDLMCYNEYKEGFM